MKRVYLLLIGLLVLGGCKDKYVSPYKSPGTGYLVVEGYITGNGPTKLVLSHTVKLPGDSTLPPEKGAYVAVEGDNSSVYRLSELGNGAYGIDSLRLDVSVRYRLRIKTTGGKEYLSDYVAYKPTPPIDSLNWVLNSDQLVIYANTHDPANATRYYQWAYDELWEYHAAEYAGLKYVDSDVSVVGRLPSEQIFRCWEGGSSTSIIIASSAKLSQDEIYRHPLLNIPSGSYKVSVLYRITVRQYALTEDAYNFLSIMQKNTESLGSIFDVQPSAVNGNIHSLSDPTERVIGFVSAGTVDQRVMYISRGQLSNWPYYFSCSSPDRPVPNIRDSLISYFGSGSMIPITNDSKGYLANYSDCLDCRAQGGTTVMPAGWPN
ncbi:MAG: DUF4249 domain-containing protein [Bacteroidetes bacterium]|nr:DUF4249 domain-containing protein [Bacteroidota bacterium]